MVKYTIEFKTFPEIWIKEESGLKPNTLRIYNKQDKRFKILSEFAKGNLKELDIKIINGENSKSFIRSVKDVTFWDDYVIISWRS